jgi:hypothetical protein
MIFKIRHYEIIIIILNILFDFSVFDWIIQIFVIK